VNRPVPEGGKFLAAFFICRKFFARLCAAKTWHAFSVNFSAALYSLPSFSAERNAVIAFHRLSVPCSSCFCALLTIWHVDCVNGQAWPPGTAKRICQSHGCVFTFQTGEVHE
jgi:hypothetical protein